MLNVDPAKFFKTSAGSCNQSVSSDACIASTALCLSVELTSVVFSVGAQPGRGHIHCSCNMNLF